jgi:hypothetical protein
MQPQWLHPAAATNQQQQQQHQLLAQRVEGCLLCGRLQGSWQLALSVALRWAGLNAAHQSVLACGGSLHEDVRGF